MVSVRFLPEEKEQLMQRASDQRISLSELLRAIALRPNEKSRIKFVPEVNRRLYFQLGQISEKLQTIEGSSDSLNEIQELLNEVRKVLMGMGHLAENE